jgi:hypothetical protein
MNRYKYIDEGRQHLHTLDGKPLFGGSTVKGFVGDKSRLFQYYADRAAVSALALPAQDIAEEYEAIQELNGFTKSNAMKELVKKYPDFGYARLAANRHRDTAADKGTKRHSRLEDYVKESLVKNGGKPFMPEDMEGYAPEIRTWILWCVEQVECFYFTEANCYHEELWTGGIADLGLKLKDGRRVVCDHKSSKEAYPDQFLQCALYDTLLTYSGGLDRDGNKLFDWEPADGYVVFPFRSQPFTPEFRWNAADYRKAAVFTAFIYKLMA